MPSHWETGVLGDYVTVKRGGSPRPIQEYLSDEGLRWLKIADVSSISGPYILEIKEHIKEEGLRKTVHLEPGSLVLSNSATPGIPKILSIDTCIHDGWLYFPQSQFTNEWLYCYFLNVRQELVRMANGSVFQNLKTDIVKNFKVIRPDDETLASFQEMVAPLFNLMESCQKENKQLADLRDTLLPKLMSGEIDVSKVDLTQLNSHLAEPDQNLFSFQIHDYGIQTGFEHNSTRKKARIENGILKEDVERCSPLSAARNTVDRANNGWTHWRADRLRKS